MKHVFEALSLTQLRLPQSEINPSAALIVVDKVVHGEERASAVGGNLKTEDVGQVASSAQECDGTGDEL